MPRPARPWFRFYSEALESLKVDILPDKLTKPWLKLLCLANVNEPRGRLPSMAKIAFALRVKEKQAQEIVVALIDWRFIDIEGTGYVMHQWDDWQKDSDVRGTKLQQNSGDSAVMPPLKRGIDQRREDKEKDQKRGEGEESAPAHPFVIAYALEHQQRNAGRPPSKTEHAAAVALEREYGADACFEVASDLDWSKHPNYMRPILQERREGKGKSLRYEPKVASREWEIVK